MTDYVKLMADKVPDEYKEQLTLAINRTYRVLTIDPTDIDYLFHIYNNFINEYELQDKNCRSCRTKVITRLRQVVNYWNENK